MTPERYTVYLIRHGLTYQNLRREYQGAVLDYDILPESRILIQQREGRGEAPELESLWVSPLIRAQKTAELYFPGMDREIWPDLVEREFGDWDGHTHLELMDRDPDYRDFVAAYGRTTPPGGESFEDFSLRLDRILHRLEKTALENPENFPLGLVFHGGVILHLSERLFEKGHPHHRFYTPGAGGLRLEIGLDPFRVLDSEELFTSDIRVEETPFYIDFDQGKSVPMAQVTKR